MKGTDVEVFGDEDLLCSAQDLDLPSPVLHENEPDPIGN